MSHVTNTARRRTAFTLIELLVVVAVIALLMAIMMPSLGKARKLSRTVVCGTNLRSIDQAMQSYAAEFADAILGNAHTSSAHLFNGDFSGLASGMGENNCPLVITSFDWMSPTAKQMGQSFDEGPTQADRVARFMQFNAFRGFTCPENDIVSTNFADGGPTLPVHLMISYNTAVAFQYTNGNPHFDNGVDQTFFSMNGYRPKIGLVGNPSQKVYMADGGRWSEGAAAPDDNAAILGSSPGGLSADWGPEDYNTRAYYQGSPIDGRIYSMRHGNQRAGAPLASFKFNLAFFDGHVETLNGLDGANPSFWFPTKSRPAVATEYITSDKAFKNLYGPTYPIQ